MACTCLGEIFTSSCLTVLSGPAWVLLSKIYKTFPGSLYVLERNVFFTSITFSGKSNTFSLKFARYSISFLILNEPLSSSKNLLQALCPQKH